MTLARKFTLVFVSISLVVVAIVSVVAFMYAQRTLESETRHHVASMNILKADQFELWVIANSDSLARIAKRPLIISHARIMLDNDVESSDYQMAYDSLYEEHLIQLINQGIGFHDLFILHPETGEILVSSNALSVGLFRENQEYFQQGRFEVYIQNPYYSLSDQRQLITIATPLVDPDGELLGVLAGNLNLDVATDIMRRGFSDNETGDAFIVNKFNFYVTEDRHAIESGERTVQTDGVNACLEGETSTGIYQNAQDITVLGAYQWIPEYELCMVTETHQSEAYQSISELGYQISIASGIVIVMGVAVSFIFSRSLIHPINQLVADTKIIGQGNLDHRIATTRKDEIGELRRAFGQMVQDLNAITASRDDLNDEIAQRRRIESRLRERETTLALSLQAAGAGIWIWDIIGQKVHWDEASERIYGLQPGTFGGTYADWREKLHPDDLDDVEQAIAQAIKGEKAFNVEFRIILPGEGQMERYVLAQGILLKNADGEYERMIGVHIDVTERKLNEEALRILTDSLGERVKELSGLYDVSAYEYQELPIADYLEKICNRIPASMQYPTVSVVDIVYSKCHYGDAKASQFPTKLTFPIKVNNEKVGKLIFAYTTPHEFLPEESLHLAEIARRIGLYIERRENYEVLKNTLHELEKSNRELQQFAYIASHDLQEPLRMVSSYLQLLQRRYEGKLDEKADQYIFYAVDGANRMKILINDLLTYSRLKTQIRPFEPVDIKQIIDSCLSNLTISIKEKQATITVEGAMPELAVDETQMMQLWQNLISNSLKYQVLDATPVVTIRAEEKEDAWQFSIQDNGIGIDAEFHDQIFAIFKRLHNRAQYDGTGIGLSVCQRIVERHRGTIWVESSLGEGATFHFTIAKNLESQNPIKSDLGGSSSVTPAYTETTKAD